MVQIAYAAEVTEPLPLVERKQRQARARIVRAAEELFLARGFDNVSVTDIAERAEVGRTTFFRHFGDKQEVVFAREQELLDSISGVEHQDSAPAARDATEAVAQLRPIVLAVCTRITADPASYTRHFQLIERHPELRARDIVKLQQMAGQLSELLIRRGTGEPVAVLAGQIALACFQTARRLGDDPHTLVDEVRNAFDRVLTLGAGH